MTAKTFLKWAGGKTQLLPQLENYYPSELKNGNIDTYFEPFIGGGAVFFQIAQNYNIKSAFLYDINPELILVYKVIQQAVEDLIDELDIYATTYPTLDTESQQKFFYKVREHYNSSRHKVKKKYSRLWIPRAAQCIFLNKTCFNGLFRMNKKGEFNVPFGKYKNPKILDVDNLRASSELLQPAVVEVSDFAGIKEKVDDNSFVYLDPPYRPISKTASFTSYAANRFDEDEQVRLAHFFRQLDSKGTKIMLSNSDPQNENPSDQFFNVMYQGYQINKVEAKRRINCKGKKRGSINELIITNYHQPRKAGNR